MLSSFACCAQVIALGVWVLVWCSVLSHLAVLGAADVILIVLKAAMGFLAWTFASAGSSAGEKWLDGYVMELVLSMVALLQCKGSLAGKVSSSTRHILTGEHLPVPHDLGLFQSSCKDGTLRALPRVHLPDAFQMLLGHLWFKVTYGFGLSRPMCRSETRCTSFQHYTLCQQTCKVHVHGHRSW